MRAGVIAQWNLHRFRSITSRPPSQATPHLT